MMICHGWYPCFNPAKRPASLSREIVTNLLREEFQFDGLIMTDDLDMGAILNEYGLEETIRLAIEAGNDWVMICHRVDSIDEVHGTLGKLPPAQIDRALENVARTKAKLAPPMSFPKRRSKKIDGRSGICAWRSSAKRKPPDEVLKTGNVRPSRPTNRAAPTFARGSIRLTALLSAHNIRACKRNWNNCSFFRIGSKRSDKSRPRSGHAATAAESRSATGR